MPPPTPAIDPQTCANRVPCRKIEITYHGFVVIFLFISIIYTIFLSYWKTLHPGRICDVLTAAALLISAPRRTAAAGGGTAPLEPPLFRSPSPGDDQSRIRPPRPRPHDARPHDPPRHRRPRLSNNPSRRSPPAAGRSARQWQCSAVICAW